MLRSYRIDQLVSMRISSVWMGPEGKDSRYGKLRGTDAFGLVRELQSHGIRVLGSTIIGLEDHTPQNIDEVIDHAVRYDTDFHQFMLYTPIPGTPLHAELSAQGRMKDEREWKSRLFAGLGGPYVLWRTRHEEKRLAQGWTHEPPTFYERNDFVEALVTKDAPQAAPCCD